MIREALIEEVIDQRKTLFKYRANQEAYPNVDTLARLQRNSVFELDIEEVRIINTRLLLEPPPPENSSIRIHFISTHLMLCALNRLTDEYNIRQLIQRLRDTISNNMNQDEIDYVYLVCNTL